MPRWCTFPLLSLPLLVLSMLLATALIGVRAAESDPSPAVQEVDTTSPTDAVRSPLRIAPGNVSGFPTIMPLVLDHEALQVVRAADRVTLRDFPLAPHAAGEVPRTIEMVLERINPFTDDARIVLGSLGDEADQPLPRPEVDLFRGLIPGEPDSRAFLSFSEHGVYGFVNRNHRTQIISSGPNEPAMDIAMYDVNALPAGAIHWRDFVCETAEPEVPIVAPPANADGGAAAGGDKPCRSILVAIETDTQFTNSLFGGNINAAAAYVATMVSAGSEIYLDNLDVQLQTGFVRLWDGPDPWDGNNTNTQLNQFQNYWNSNMGFVDRHLAHFLSGRSLGGGLAYLNAVCHPFNGYAISASLNGFFPYPLQDNSGQNWDIIVFTHELGHNVGTPHTHNYCPPLDECAPQQYWGNCQDETDCINNGTIMSYCHLCSGGASNIVLEFHPTVNATIENYLDSLTECSLSCEVLEVPSEFTSIQAAIDQAVGGDTILVGPGTYFEALDLDGKPVVLQSSGGPEATIIDATGTDASAIHIENAGAIGAKIAGFTIRGGSGTFSANQLQGGGIFSMNSAVEVDDCIFIDNLADRGGAIANQGASLVIRNSMFENNHANVFGGAVFNFNAESSLYETSSFISNTTDGSAGAIFNVGSIASIDQCSFLQNVAANSAGAVSADSSSLLGVSNSDFCDNLPTDFGGAWSDDGGNTFCPPAVPGDLDENGIVNVLDMLALLSEWGPCNGCPADLTDDDIVDVLDLLELLSHWG